MNYLTSRWALFSDGKTWLIVEADTNIPLMTVHAGKKVAVAVLTAHNASIQAIHSEQRGPDQRRPLPQRQAKGLLPTLL